MTRNIEIPTYTLDMLPQRNRGLSSESSIAQIAAINRFRELVATGTQTRESIIAAWEEYYRILSLRPYNPMNLADQAHVREVLTIVTEAVGDTTGASLGYLVLN